MIGSVGRIVILVAGLGALILAGCPELLPAPVCDFNATPVTGVAPLTVAFANTSDYQNLPPQRFAWVFGDGDSSITEHPTHTYTTPGVYSVFLSVTTKGGEAQLLREDFITVEAPTQPPVPVCDFDATPKAGDAPLTVSFTNTSDLGGEALIQAQWLFGDGASSAEENPSHTYVQPGTYSVHLRMNTAGGSSELLREAYITVEAPASTLAPVIHLLGAAETHVECGNPYVDSGAIAFDHAGAEIPVEATPDLINTSGPGTHTIIYRAVDGDGLMAPPVTRQVIVADTTPPVVDLEDSFFVAECGTHSNFPGGTAFDTCAGPLEVTLVDSVTLDTPGFAVAQYEAMDPSGNVGSASLLVAVEDTTPPLLTLVGGNGTAPYGGAYREQGYIVAESCDKYPQVKYAPAEIDTKTIGARERTYYAIDADGNRSAELTRSIAVVPPCEGGSGWSTEGQGDFGGRDMALLGLRNCGMLLATTHTLYSYAYQTSLYRFSAEGDVLWRTDHNLGETANTRLFEAPGGEILMAGMRDPYSYYYSGYKPFLAQFTSNGSLLATRDNFFPDAADAELTDAAMLSDGSIVVVGYVWDDSSWDYESVVMKIGPLFAEIQWTQRLSELGAAVLNGVTATSDGNIVVVGSREDGYSDATGISAKLDPEGNILWQREIDRSFAGLGAPVEYDVSRTVRVTSDLDGGCIATGYIYNWVDYYEIISVFAVALDDAGNRRWATVLSQGEDDEPENIVRLLDGRYAITIKAYTYSYGYENRLFLVDNTGASRVQTAPGSGFFRDLGLAPLNDGGLATVQIVDPYYTGIKTYSLEELQHWGE